MEDNLTLFEDIISEKSGETVRVRSLEDQMKLELLMVAYNKFTITELEEKLGGNKFQIM